MFLVEVLRVIKTKQVTYAILVHLSAYVTSLEEAGLLEGKETGHLHDMVQALLMWKVDLKKLNRDPPLVRMPTAVEALSNHPFFGALPAAVQRMLLKDAKEFMLLRDNVLYAEDAMVNGVWLIANGNVKWSSTKYTDRRQLHPIFSHGSTLGLYEDLRGKPGLCRMTADSVVHCFLIENEKLMAALYTEEGLEEFCWQESSLVIARLVNPQQFETVTMQEFRALITEGSLMRTYIRGEVIEIEVSRIGILLGGFVKQEGKDDVIGAPAGLLNQVSEITHRGSWADSLLPQSVIFHAEARCRVLFLDLHSGQITSSIPSMTSILPPQFGEHGSLPRFPSYHNSLGRLIDAAARLSSKSLNTQENPSPSYSAKAMELCLFGNNVNLRSGRRKSRLSSQNLPRKSSTPAQSHGGAVGKSFLSALTLAPAPKTEKVIPTQRRVQSHGDLVSTNPPLRHPKLRKKALNVYSSGESDEEEHIVEIASPSSLFRNPNSAW